MPDPSSKKQINLALQGGGAHGAFTWGVLDEILEDGRIEIEGISATSAGAMNAAALANGMVSGGRDGAREALKNFWQAIAKAGDLYYPFGDANPFMEAASNFWERFSPYQLNPLNLNPLRNILEDQLDFDAIHTCDCVKLFIAATDVEQGTAQIFQNQNVSIDTLLASACLPQLFQAVEIKERAYWDGGYMGNPSLWPLFYHADCRDILLVHINPITREGIPTSTMEIENRLNEITFNSALLKELRAIDFVKKLIHDDMIKDEYKDKYRDILLHAIRTDDALQDLPVGSKTHTDWSFLTDLRDKGRAAGQAWIAAHYDDIGQRASVNIQRDYLGHS